ncbi:MAG: prepilin peptidase [Vicinamibacterales bacterium]
MPSTVSIAVVAVASLAAASDVATRRIPNWLTLGAAAVALAYHVAVGGWVGFALAAAGWLVGTALFFPFFALGGMGAGDVKLVGALGAWLGPLGAVQVAIAAALAGGLVAVIVMLRARYLRTAFANLRLLFTHWGVNGIGALPELTLAQGSGPRLAYAVPILIGTLGVLWWL